MDESPNRGLIRLQAAIGHTFAQQGYLVRALTHRSAIEQASARERVRRSNERMEFLGDRVLGLIVADMLLFSFPSEPEGLLAPRLNALVRAETLAEIARELDLGSHLILGDAENQGDARENTSILADACEAIIGALYADGGLRTAEKFIRTYFSPFMNSEKTPPKDAKTALQEWAQGRGLPLPVYRVTQRSGPDHAPEFTVVVVVKDHGDAAGVGASKRLAEQEAAGRLLDRLTGTA